MQFSKRTYPIGAEFAEKGGRPFSCMDTHASLGYRSDRKVHENDKAGARGLLEGFETHLEEAGLGTHSEIFDAEPPYQPRGCVAQAWSVAEVLRCWVKTAS
jgi:glycogen debranching enzyme